MIEHGTPFDFGWKRERDLDGLVHGRNVWRRLDGVLISLPAGCKEVELETRTTIRGEDTVVVHPPGAASVWLTKRTEPKP